MIWNFDWMKICAFYAVQISVLQTEVWIQTLGNLIDLYLEKKGAADCYMFESMSFESMLPSQKRKYGSENVGRISFFWELCNWRVLLKNLLKRPSGICVHQWKDIFDDFRCNGHFIYQWE